MVTLEEFVGAPLVQSAGVILGAIVSAWVVEIIILKALVNAASKTETDLDDKVIEILRRPVFLSVLLLGLWWSVHILDAADFSFFHENAIRIDAVLQTFVILLWSVASTRVGEVLLRGLANNERRSVVRPRTLPVFDIFMRVIVGGLSIYFVFLAWDINLTAWIASAGIVGVAFGFAAKDTLANLFSGIFILADGPYKVGDWIVLDELRGEVTHIGIRSTRVLTPDDVEITVPNAIIANARLLNETGGPYVRQRLRVGFSVAYGSDIDRVREVVLAAVAGTKGMREQPEPRTIFESLGASGLEFTLWAWIDDPRARDLVVDRLTERIYKSLGDAGIEIPYPKQDVYLHNAANAQSAAAPPAPDALKGSG